MSTPPPPPPEGPEREHEPYAGGEGESSPPPYCDFCGEWRALLHCKADDAKLCLACDSHVHNANAVCSRHPRSLLCDACRSAPSTILCSTHRLLLCANCDFDHAHPSARHDRRPVEPFTGCPGTAELAGLLGVGGVEKGVEEWWEGEDGSAVVRENWLLDVQPVLCLDDLIVPTTADHGFQPLASRSFPKNQDLSCGKHKKEIIRQLCSMGNSESYTGCHALVEEAHMGVHHPKVENMFQMDSKVFDFDSEDATRSQPDVALWHNNYCEAADPFPHSANQLPSKSHDNDRVIIPNHPPDVCSPDGEDDAGDIENSLPILGGGGGMQPLLPKACLELSGQDRDTALSRYREKRKTRRYDKRIRYESRKVRAECRVRIKGRFAKMNEDKKSRHWCNT